MLHLTLNDLPTPPSGKTGWPWTGAQLDQGNRIPEGAEWPRISIVTPSFHQGEFLEGTIRSVLLQGYPNLEYLIIDGGSTDNSVEIIKKYERWISYWESEKDRGQSHAINKGFAKATGEIWAWLCSDDWLAPGALEKVALLLKGMSQAMVVGCSIRRMIGPPRREILDCRKPSYEQMLYAARSFPQPSVFWTSDLGRSVGPVKEQINGEELYFAMDYDLWLRMIPLARVILHSEEVLSIALCHGEQKGARAKKDGTLFQFDLQRAMVALEAARINNLSPLAWYFQIWFIRIKNALKQRRLTLLMPSEFHKAGFKLLTHGKY